MNDALTSIRSTISEMTRGRRWLFAVSATLVHIVIVTFVTSESTPIPTLIAIVLYAMLVMFLTGTWRKAHVWAPTILLLLCVYPFLATLTVTISELVATNIALRSTRDPAETVAQEPAGKAKKADADRGKRKKRRKGRRHSQ